MTRRTGFVGLGQMGLPIACNLSRGGCDVTAFGRRKEAAARIEEAGGRWTSDPADLANCEVLMTCLPGDDALVEVLFSAPGLAATMAENGLVVDLSTISHATTLAVAERLSEAGIAFLDAPVSGMAARARDGSLTVMCGGDTATFERARPLLERIGTTILHLGPTGSGQLVKLFNQLLFDVNAAALAELMPIAVKLGLDAGQMAAIVNSGTGRSYASEFFLPRILNGVFTEGYPMKAAYKDLVAGAELTARLGLPAPVLAAATVTYQQALLKGFGAEDKGAMIRVFEDLLGITVRAAHNQDGS